jgi:hypothetical protein
MKTAVMGFRFCTQVAVTILKGWPHKEFEGLLTSVADPDHFDADPDPDPTSEKTRMRIRIWPNDADPCGSGSGSDQALYKIL